jgi:alkanesulfonate monooxygenase SsuD/methylene tetrahydromethanopterin reductase-like flavin-dependent oxidoreductase (luciferase family)
MRRNKHWPALGFFSRVGLFALLENKKRNNAMARFTLRLDMRAPPFANTPADLYRIGLDMAQWADEHGFSECMLSEHHGADDDYLPSPLVYAGAIAARTEQIRLRISALILPLHDPLRIAEDVAVLDRISQGRIELVVAGGFRPPEFAMFDRKLADRGKLVEEGVEAIKQAWSGKPFEYRGRTVCVTPRPLQLPRPPILLGGSTKVAARRAARIADGFVPAVPELYAFYLQECKKLGVNPGESRVIGPAAVFVSENPDACWAKIAPHVLHETNAYARWYAETGTSGPYQPIGDVDALRASGIYQVLTPGQCFELANELGDTGWIFIQPLLGGLDPQVGWETLHLLGDKVLPELGL